VNGPVRCHLNGRFNYLTAETAKQCPWYSYPVALPAAAVCDAGIIVADTVAVPVISLGHLGPDGKSHPVYSIFWLPFYPLVCFMAMAFYGDSLNDGVLYQRLLGYHYFTTEYGTFKIIDSANPDGYPQTILKLNDQTISVLLGRLNNISNNADNIVASLSDGTVIWWRRMNGKWEPKPFDLVPSNSELTKAISKQIEFLTIRKNNAFEQKYSERIAREIGWWQNLSHLLENVSPVIKEVTEQGFSKENGKSEQEQNSVCNEVFGYKLRLECQSYEFDVFCSMDMNTTNTSVISVDHYFMTNF
ncbi:MAG: hypothetical protein IJS08_09665, partial [Victivallales bacterium]|nr:hypothetical protein [Victivallales bacterium]